LVALAQAPIGSRIDSHPPVAGKVLLVRGVLTVFSLGLDELAERLRQRGLDVQVVPASLSYAAAERLTQQYEEGRVRGPLVLIGHSLGADLLPMLARQFARRGLSVDLVVMIDSTNPGEVPPNVRRCVNLYQSNTSPPWFGIVRGAPITAQSESTEVVNVDIRTLAKHSEAAQLHHFNIESSAWIHGLVLREVLPVFRSGGPGTVDGTIAPASATSPGARRRPPR
jgi:hypothetical protein